MVERRRLEVQLKYSVKPEVFRRRDAPSASFSMAVRAYYPNWKSIRLGATHHLRFPKSIKSTSIRRSKCQAISWRCGVATVRDLIVADIRRYQTSEPCPFLAGSH